MRQQFKEDQAELEAHFAERVQSYIELGETPEQARVSTAEKFGEIDAVAGELQRQRVFRSPIIWSAIWAVSYMLLLLVFKGAGMRTMLSAIFMAYACTGPHMRKRCTRRRRS